MIVDPVCSLHGIPWSKHPHGRCLYCCLCFKALTIAECHINEDGESEDVCESCATK